MTRTAFLRGAASVLIAGASTFAARAAKPDGAPHRLVLSDAEWRRRLSPAAFDVLRRAGTERPYSSPLLNEHRRGTFACAGCRLSLFASATKFDSRTGWPSFYRPLPHAVATRTDATLPGEPRTEVRCARCDGHLGHVFEDGPPPTGLRYCMNGVALAFEAG